jgi:hypothetical protein
MSRPAKPVERYVATKVFAVVLSGLVALYGFMGWFMADELFKAMVCLVAQGLAINAAIAARRAFAKHKLILGIVGLGFTVGFAMWSEQGLHHAWTSDGSEISPLLTWFLCAVEPMLFWFTEEVQHADKPVNPADMADQVLEEMRGSVSPALARPGSPRVETGRRVKGLAAGLATSVALAAAPAHAVSPGHAMSPEPITRPAGAGHVRTEDPARAQALLMIRQGQMPTAVHTATGVPMSTLKRWRKELRV